MLWTLITLLSEEVTKFYSLYFSLKALNFIAQSFFLYKLLKEEIKNVEKKILILGALYTITGELFYPGYHMAFIQIVLISSTIYKLEKSFYYKYIFILTTAMLAALNWNFYDYDLKYPSELLDNIFAIAGSSLLSLLIYNIYKNKVQSKDFELMTLGSEYIKLTHSVKNQLAANVMMLENGESKETISDNLILVAKSLNDINLILKEDNKAEQVCVREMINIAIKDLGYQRNIFQINENSSLKIKVKKSSFKTILINLLSNSIKHGSHQEHIQIKINANDFTITNIINKNKEKNLLSSKIGTEIINDFVKENDLDMFINKDSTSYSVTIKAKASSQPT
jgi:hypothetical protein